MTKKSRIILGLFGIAAVLYIVALAAIPQTETSEARYALIASSMAESNDFVTPMLKEAPYLEKPPLVYWASAIIFKVFGENDLTARLFVAFCTIGCVLLVFGMARHFYGTKVGVYSAAILAFSLFHFIIGRINVLDMPLAFFVSLAIWCGYLAFENGQANKKWLYALYFFSALAFLTKGLIGIIFPGAVIFFWLLLTKRWRELYKLFSPVGVVIFLIVVLPWIILVQQAQSDFLYFFFIYEHFVRFATKVHQRYQPFYFFIPVLLVGCIPWLGYLWQVLEKQSKGAILEAVGKERAIFLSVWAGLIFLFFSASSSKLVPYIAPVFLPLAVVGGRIFSLYERVDEKKSNWRRYLPQALQSLLLIAGIAVVVMRENDGFGGGFFLLLSLPLFCAVLLAFLPNYLLSRYGKESWFLSLSALGFLLFFSLLFPAHFILAPYKTAKPVIEAMTRFIPQGETLYQFRTNIYGIDFYSKTRTPLIDVGGEIEPGVKKLPLAEREKYFPSQDEFMKLYNQGGQFFVLFENDDKYDYFLKLFPEGRLIWKNKKYYLFQLEKTGVS
ncbi:MAG: glycosyltransferase family 39 protein [Deltaproteobacteria bacterium]|nr:glycosyltransferase family 39 protein [Deltaproteobacteria bacterium]